MYLVTSRLYKKINCEKLLRTSLNFDPLRSLILANLYHKNLFECANIIKLTYIPIKSIF